MRLPLDVMERVDDTTARLIAGTLAPRHTRDEHVAPVDGQCLTVEQWRSRHDVV